MKLKELYRVNRHTTDKGGSRPGNHSYLELYDELFPRLQHRTGRILEIGVETGDSLNLWAEYFINSEVYGIECDMFNISIPLHPHVKVLGMNAYCKETLALLKWIGKFDVIIDDAAHILGQQKYFIQHYWELLSEDGIMIIEEAAEDEMEDKRKCAQELISLFPIEFQKHTIQDDRRLIKNHPGDYLIICNMEHHE